MAISSTTITNALQTLFLGIAQYSQYFGKVFAGSLGGVAAALDFYSFIEAIWKKDQPQRKTTIATHGATLILNALYTAGVILGFLAKNALNYLALAVDILYLAKISYVTHQLRNKVFELKQQRSQGTFIENNLATHERHLATARDKRLKSKIEVGYTVASLISTGIFIGACVFSTWMYPAVLAFFTLKTIQFIDYVTGFSAKLFAGKTRDEPAPTKRKKKKRTQSHADLSSLPLEPTASHSKKDKRAKSQSRTTDVSASSTAATSEKAPPSNTAEAYANGGKHDHRLLAHNHHNSRVTNTPLPPVHAAASERRNSLH